MNPKAVHGKILALTKNVFLRKPEGQESFESAFLMKAQGRISPFGTKWWTTSKTDILCLDLAQAMVRIDAGLSHGDEQTFKGLVLEVVRDSLLDPQLFDFTKIFPPVGDTLFDVIVPSSKAKFAENMLVRMLAACQGAIRDWLVIYPLQRVHSDSFALGFNGISLVDASDLKTWSAFASRFADARMFDLRTATWFADSGAAPFLPLKPSTWLVCETKGTVLGARLLAAQRMRTFVALALGLGRGKRRSLFYKSGLEPCTYSVQFAGLQGNSPSNQLASIGPLLPPLLEDWVITKDFLEQIADWHRKCASAPSTEVKRAITASQFLHYAIIADDIERFIHLFITLDALFGERGKVEASISAGVSKVFTSQPDWVERTRLLFDLRSEVVHGECSNITEWNEVEKYTRRFQSTVSADAVTLAVNSLIRFFDLPRQSAAERIYHPLTKPLARGLFRVAGWLNQA